jgi:hypothetical protein
LAITWTTDSKPLFSGLSQRLRKGLSSGLSSAITDTVLRNISGKGGKKLWQQIAKSITTTATETEVKLTSTHAAALMRNYGGTIKARNKQWLTIPASAAQGKSVKEMRSGGWKIFRIPGPGGGYLLGNKGKGTKTELLFSLRSSVQHPASPYIPDTKALFQMIDTVFKDIKL